MLRFWCYGLSIFGCFGFLVFWLWDLSIDCDSGGWSVFLSWWFWEGCCKLMLLGVVYRIIVMIFEERENVSEIIKSFLVYLVIVDNSFEFIYFYFF